MTQDPKTILFFALAGLISGMMFIGVLSGSVLAFPLLLITPVPIAIAALGWGTWAGFGSALLGAGFVLIFSKTITAALFLGFIGLPIAYLAHCIGLSRDDNEDGKLEWFPLDIIFFRACLIAAGLSAIGLYAIGFEPQASYEFMLKEFTASENFANLAPDAKLAFENTLRLAVSVMPYTTPAIWVAVLLFALFVGGRITRRRNLLKRPWPDLGMINLPPYAILLFGIGLGSAFLTHPVSTYGAPFAGAFGVGFALVGFAIIHVITRGMNSRGILLTALYIGAFFLTIPLFIMLGLGLVEQRLNLRGRFANKSGTPPPTIH